MRHNPYILIGGNLPTAKVYEFIKVLPKEDQRRINVVGIHKWIKERRHRSEDCLMASEYHNTLFVVYHNIPISVKDFLIGNELPFIIPNQDLWWAPGHGKSMEGSLGALASESVMGFIEMAERYSDMSKVALDINAEGHLTKILVKRILKAGVSDKYENLKFLLIHCLNPPPAKLPDFKIV